MNYYSDMSDAPLFDLLRWAIFKTENQLIAVTDSILSRLSRHWQKYRIIYSIISRWSNWTLHTCFRNSWWTKFRNRVQCSIHFRNGFSTFQDINSWIIEQGYRYSSGGTPPIVFDSKSAVCIASNGKDTNHTRHIANRVQFVRNGKSRKIHKIDCCEEGLKLVENANNNVDENNLNPRIKYIMVRLDNWYRTLVKKGWHDIGYIQWNNSSVLIDWIGLRNRLD